MAIPVLSLAPDFELKSLAQDGMISVKLSDRVQDGPVLLLFFPAAFTHVCQKQLCDMNLGMQEYAELGVQVYGVSVDLPYSQEAWARANNITVPLISDFAKSVTRDFDLVWPNFSGLGADVSSRAVVLIDQSRIVRHIEVTPTLLDLPDMDLVREAIAKL